MRLDVATLLRLQRSAYALLLRLDSLGRDNPAWLAPEVIAELRTGASATAWLRANRSAFPAEFWPEAEDELRFGNLVASFFRTSMRTCRLSYDGETTFACLRPGLAHGRRPGRRIRAAVASALHELLTHERAEIDIRTARRLATSSTIARETHVLAYVWSLERRSRGSFRGAVVHGIWKSLPRDLRTDLSEEIVWLAFDAVRTEAKRSACDAPNVLEQV
ncbi:MAG TPA: hypothetical protein P5081_13660 [Phycisphaerae bacterium]|nr:hypothetical protein [Phycisphaerae bacterium]HRW53917.1 hypothetical protein [Phycisphaerae bacterium]